MAYNSYINFNDTTLERHYSKSYAHSLNERLFGLGYNDLTSRSSFYTGNGIADSGSAGSNNKLLGYALSNLNVTNFNNFIQHAQCAVPSGTLGIYSPQVVRLRKTKVKNLTNFYDSNYLKLYGLPVNQVMSLSTLTGRGYTQLTDFHLEGANFAQCTTDELNALDTLLRGGIIL